jgi:ATP-dependent helicase/nuclease subunit A
LDDEELKEAVRFIAATQEIPLLEVIQKGHVEWGFSFQHQDFWIQGQIDLWGKVGSDIWIVDYKTGSSDFAANAFDQLKAYTWALHRMDFIQRDSQVHLAVVYPFEKKIKTEKNLDLVQLEAAIAARTSSALVAELG